MKEDTIGYFVILSVVINIFFLGYVVVRLLIRLVKNVSSEHMQEWAVLDDISSIYFQLYLHVFAVPFTEISIRCIFLYIATGFYED